MDEETRLVGDRGKPLCIESVLTVVNNVHEAVAELAVELLGKQAALKLVLDEAEEVVTEGRLVLGAAPLGWG